MLSDLLEEVGLWNELESYPGQEVRGILFLHPAVFHPALHPSIDLNLGGEERISRYQLREGSLREREKSLGLHHISGVHIDEGATGLSKVLELVETCHIVDDTDIEDTEGGLEIGGDGLLEQVEIVLIGQP